METQAIHQCISTTRSAVASLVRSLVAVLSVLTWGVAAAAVPNPAVTGPVPATVPPGNPAHDYPFFATTHDLTGHGYVEEEFFIQGTANRYNTPAAATGSVIDGDHPYTTRLIVRRPADPRRFNGTVLVEWLNVTNGFDADNTWFFIWEHVLRAGYAWVGVSAQHIGVDRLKTFSPTRYGSFNVTNNDGGDLDAYSYDIFSQAAQAIRHPTGVKVLGGLKPKVIIATGESQSASRLSTYVNSIDPLTPVYDGFLLLSSLGNTIRTDLRVPVWKVLTEFDVGALEARVRQPDTNLFRTWEVAGTSHVDQHLRASREPLELRDFSTSTTASSSEAILSGQCQVPSIGTRVPTQYVLAAAYDALVTWITKGRQPPSAPPIQTSGSPPVIDRDDMGLALGGIRLSQLAVPTAYNVGFNVGPGACVRWGYSQPFDIALLNQLYRSHGRYVAAVEQVTKHNLHSGYILKPDADYTVWEALISGIGQLDRLEVDSHKPLATFDRNP
jgi:Alpha/beta hydrolase domain